jgi:hypothetical protein
MQKEFDRYSELIGHSVDNAIHKQFAILAVTFIIAVAGLISTWVYVSNMVEANDKRFTALVGKLAESDKAYKELMVDYNKLSNRVYRNGVDSELRSLQITNTLKLLDTTVEEIRTDISNIKANNSTIHNVLKAKCVSNGASVDGTPLSAFEVTSTYNGKRSVSAWLRYTEPGLRKYYTISIDK